MAAAARQLGLSRTTLDTKLRQLRDTGMIGAVEQAPRRFFQRFLIAPPDAQALFLRNGRRTRIILIALLRKPFTHR